VGICDSERHITSKFPTGKGLHQPAHPNQSSQDATEFDQTRLSCATPSATCSEPTGSDLAVVIDAWPTLPEAINAGIVALVRAASSIA
jgi:hypothetical protein